MFVCVNTVPLVLRSVIFLDTTDLISAYECDNFDVHDSWLVDEAFQHFNISVSKFYSFRQEEFIINMLSQCSANIFQQCEICESMVRC